MRRFMVTIHAGGIHVDEQRPGACEQQQTTYYADPNFTAFADYKLAGEFTLDLAKAQQDVGAGRAVSQITHLTPPPLDAA